jgi:3-dehydroquinate synthase
VVFLAQQAGVAVGILGGVVGLIAGVPVAIWVGRTAVGRVAPWFIPEAELARLRDGMQRHAVLTLACMRSVPVLAETSVMIAAAVGVPARRIFFATLLPNLAIAVVYALAGNDSLLTALIAFLATVTLSYGAWRFLESRRKAA